MKPDLFMTKNVMKLFTPVKQLSMFNSMMVGEGLKAGGQIHCRRLTYNIQYLCSVKYGTVYIVTFWDDNLCSAIRFNIVKENTPDRLVHRHRLTERQREMRLCSLSPKGGQGSVIKRGVMYNFLVLFGHICSVKLVPICLLPQDHN